MKSRVIKKVLSLLVAFTLIWQQTGFAQGLAQLDIAGYLSKSNPFSAPGTFRPLHLRYFSYDPLTDNFRILLDKGNLKDLKDSQLKEQGQELLKYFLVGITLPDENFWVNLRPDSEDQIISRELARTDLGKVLLEADLELKKDVARFTSPETPEGREYWNKLYAKAGQIFSAEGGSAYGGNFTIPTLTRPWIVPGEVIIRENANSAYVYKGTLKVMLEQDHLKNSADYNFKDPRLKELNEYSSQLIRQKIIPKLTKEVNSSKKYAALRQVFFSLILSRWFKHKFAGTSGQYASLINTGNLNGLASQNTWSKTTYFKAYQKSFSQGEYNIKEQVNTVIGPTIRTYFSGGVSVMAEDLNIPVSADPTLPVGTFSGSNPVITAALGKNMVSLTGIASNGQVLPGLETKELNLEIGKVSSPLSQSPLLRFREIGQQIWIDGLTLEMLSNGYFEGLVRDHGITGVTTNPPLIKAYLKDTQVLDKAKGLAQTGLNPEQVYYALIKDLVTQVIGIFKKYGVQGKFSVELDPKNADDVQASVEEAMQWTDIDHEYMMVKVPATEAAYRQNGIIEQIIAQGRNVNVTLIFSPGQYRRVAEAYIRGLRRAKTAGKDLSKIYSVASFFISRWDTKYVDKISVEHQGMFANAVAIVAYNEIFRNLFDSSKFKEELATQGARAQGFLLASTGSKAKSMPEGVRSHYPADVYVTNVMGESVVNTLPAGTIDFLIGRGEFEPRPTIVTNHDHAKIILGAMRAKGVDIEKEAGRETGTLFSDGMASFAKDFADIMQTLQKIVAEAKGEAVSSPATASEQGRRWWHSLPSWRKQLLFKFFGETGRMITIPADHNNPTSHFKHAEFKAEEAQLAIFTSMADYVKSFLIHPETMLGRIETTTGRFVNLKEIARRIKAREISAEDKVKSLFGLLQLHPNLPKDRTYVVKWEANSTPNGDPAKGADFTIGNRPKNQGEELGISLVEIAQLKEAGVVGIKFMTYIDSDKPETLSAIVAEVKNQRAAAHQAQLLFFPEDLPAKTMDGVALGGNSREKQLKEATWAARNPLLFAQALQAAQVDFDSYKCGFPGTFDNYKGTAERIITDTQIEANLEEMARYTQGRLAMMLSGGAADTAQRAEFAIRVGLPLVGFFPGRGVWGKSFWDEPVASAEDPSAKATVLGRIKEDLRVGGTKRRYDELTVVMARMKPFWELLGYSNKEEVQAASSPLTIDAEADVPLAQLQGFAGVLNEHRLQVDGVKVMRLKGQMAPGELFNQPQVFFAVGTSIAQALGSRFFAGGGKKVKDIADANAVYFSEQSILAYVKANPNAAVVILGDEGKRDYSDSLEVGTIYYSGYEGTKKKFEPADLEREITRLEIQGVILSFFVGDALEVTNGLIVEEAITQPTDSWSLVALLDKFNPLVNDGARIGGVSFNAPTDARVTPFDLPSEALPKIALAKFIQPASAKFADFMNHTSILVCGPREIKKAHDMIGAHKHQAIIDDALGLKDKYSGLKLVFPGDGDLMPRVVSTLGLDLGDGYRMVTFGRSGSPEATAARLVAAIAEAGQFLSTYVAKEATDHAYNGNNAYQYTSKEVVEFERLGIPDSEYMIPKTRTAIKGKGILAMTSVTGASVVTFGEGFSMLLQRITTIPFMTGQGGIITANTFVVARDGSVFVVQTRLFTSDLVQSRISIRSASKEAKEYLGQQASSSALSSGLVKDNDAPVAPGGIDFRAIPMITQPMGNLSGLSFSLPKLTNVENINLDEELNQIQKMLKAGITPSGARLKEFVAACYQKGELKQHLDGIVASIVDSCKLEEEKVDVTSNAVKEVMLILDSIG